MLADLKAHFLLEKVSNRVACVRGVPLQLQAAGGKQLASLTLEITRFVSRKTQRDKESCAQV